MAGRNIAARHEAVTTGGSDGYLTVTSSAGFYVTAKVWMSNTDVESKFCEVTEIPSGTSIGIRFVPVKGEGPNYGRSDMSDFTGGFIDQEPQFIYNRNDEPLA